MARISKIEKLDQDDSNTFVTVNDIEFKNGIIEVDVCAKLREDAPAHARGFIGIVFRVNENTSEFESFYIRPMNGKDCTDPIRKLHACQYFAFPGYTFSYFREFGITKYECPLETISLNKWSHIRAEIVNDKLAFEVNPLLHNGKKGKFGMYTDIGTDGYFKNLQYEILDTI